MVGEREVEQALDASGRGARARSSASIAAARSISRRRRRPTRSHASASGGRARGGAVGGLGGEVDRAHVLVDARGEAVRRRAVAARRAPSRARRGPAAVRLPACQKASVISRSTAALRGLGVARVDEALRGERVVALGHRVLGGGHEALDALGARVGLGEVDELQRAGRDRAHAGLELHARPLLDVVARRR